MRLGTTTFVPLIVFGLAGGHIRLVSAQEQAAAPPSTATIAGHVIATQGSTPLAGALVTLVALEGSAAADGGSIEPSRVTDAGGGYTFANISPGRYRLVFTHPRYRPTTIDVEVSPEATLTLSAALAVALAPLRQDTAAIVTGQIVDQQRGTPLANVEVTVEGTRLRTVTDAEGRYWLAGVPPGPQVLRARFLGYAQARANLTIPIRGTVTRDIRLAASALVLEGVVVTADPVSRAEGEVGTATVIDQEAIKHHTATSLAGVLELTPGVPLQPPGLDNLQQIALRSAPTSGAGASTLALPGGTLATDLASFGTAIIVDGIPQSNNANLQSLGPRGELSFSSAASGGIDLRTIPASTLERVEVIRGIPSARWGDLTQGAIIVETRAGVVDPELKVLYDARTTEAALVGGRGVGRGHTGTMTFDFAGTRTAPGSSDDYVYRVAAQLLHRYERGSDPFGSSPRLRMDTRVDFSQLFDDRPENPKVGRDQASTSRNRGFRISERARFALRPNTRLTFTGAVTTVQQRSAAWADLTRTGMPFTDRLTEGRQEGHFVIGPYRAEVAVEGTPWLAYGRFELDGERTLFRVPHRWRAGLELRREWNTGPGLQFNIEFPPQVRFNGVNGFDRPRRNDDVPPLATSALYVDDQIVTTLGPVVTHLQAGVRLDLLHEGSSWFSAVRDAVLQPRLNLELAPLSWLRLRGGYGRLTKVPPLSLLAPAPQYYDIVNVNYYADDPVERLAVLSTFIRDPSNDALGFTKASKAEAGVELSIGQAEFSLVAFHDQIDDGFGYRGDPTFLLRELFALSDSVLGNGIKPDIIEPAERSDTVPVLLLRPANIISQTNRGLELIATLPEIPGTNTRIQVLGSLVETRQQSDALYFGSAGDFSSFQLLETDPRTPYWEGATEIGKRTLMVYRLIHHQPHVGLIVTATVQHNVSDEIRDVAGTDTLAFLGYVTRDAQLVPVPESERGRDEYRDLRLPRSGLAIEPRATPADWMLTVQVSKTLPLGGRLNFWAYNLLDRRGNVVGGGVRPRPYAPVRVGLELTMPLRAAWAWSN